MPRKFASVPIKDFEKWMNTVAGNFSPRSM